MQKEIPIRFWLRLSVFNLLLVAFIGVVLRYKIVGTFPYVDQKYLLHGHSHFAFSGWVSLALMSLMLQTISRLTKQSLPLIFNRILWINAIAAYGMLLSFPLQGYGVFSIFFSTLSIFTSYYFGWKIWQILNDSPIAHPSFLWFRGAVIFNALSSIGAFALAYMMANKIIHQNWYLAAVYFFLHFQYNGWFVFGCVGLLIDKLNLTLKIHAQTSTFFWMFAFACIPAYFLSALWMPMPGWVYWLVVVSAFAQVVAWVRFIYTAQKENAFEQMPKQLKKILWLPAIAMTLKLLLQLGSTIPLLSKLAFGFRPIVIGYLHLVLLGIVSLFLLAMISQVCFNSKSKLFQTGIWLLAIGICINELVLMMQGTAAMLNIVLPFLNEVLLMAALMMFMAVAWLNRFVIWMNLNNQ
ncbi:MAG: hypothetical protein RLY16_1712 [Bacteroidota bacterium]